MFSPAHVQSPLSLQFHILGLSFCSLKIRNITVSDKALCRPLRKAQGHPTDGASVIAVRMKDYLKKFGLNVGCGERLWDRGWCCRKVLFMAFSLICFEVTGMSCVFYCALKLLVSCWVSLFSEVLYWTSSSFLLPCYSAGPWAERARQQEEQECRSHLYREQDVTPAP